MLYDFFIVNNHKKIFGESREYHCTFDNKKIEKKTFCVACI